MENKPQTSGGLALRPDVSLRCLEPTDAERIFTWVSDSSVAANIGLRSTPTLKYTSEWVDRVRTDPDDIFARAILRDQTHVGNVVLDQIDWRLRMARISLYLGDPLSRGCGIGTTAMYLALKIGFSVLTLDKIWLTVHSRHFRGIQTYSSLGFQLEGIHRAEFILDGERLATLYMGLLAPEFARLIVLPRS